VTQASSQIDDQHSVLQDVTITGQELTVDGVVLTLADSTHSSIGGETIDRTLINASNSLIDLRNTQGDFYILGGMVPDNPQPQIIRMTDTALTVDGVDSVVTFT